MVSESITSSTFSSNIPTESATVISADWKALVASCDDKAYPKVYRNGAAQFPWMLHRLLDDAETNGFDNIVSWLPCGRLFMVHDREALIKRVLPHYAQQSQYKSFARSLNLWGFTTCRRCCGCTRRGAYFNEQFVRGKPELAHKMIRIKVKAHGRPGCAYCPFVAKNQIKQTTLADLVKEQTLSGPRPLVRATSQPVSHSHSKIMTPLSSTSTIRYEQPRHCEKATPVEVKSYSSGQTQFYNSINHNIPRFQLNQTKSLFVESDEEDVNWLDKLLHGMVDANSPSLTNMNHLSHLDMEPTPLREYDAPSYCFEERSFYPV